MVFSVYCRALTSHSVGALLHSRTSTLRSHQRMMGEWLPHFSKGKVVEGFGRGSKELGVPTANFPEDIVAGLPPNFPTGVYYGWAKVEDGDVHKMVMSVGWNPFYHNEKKSMETHILHSFKEDFYGSILGVIVTGYIREQKGFSSLDELITAIKSDIAQAEEQLEEPEHKIFKKDNFFQQKILSS